MVANLQFLGVELSTALLKDEAVGAPSVHARRIGDLNP